MVGRDKINIAQVRGMGKGWLEAFSDGVLVNALAIPLSFANAALAHLVYVLVALVWLVPDRRIEAMLDGHRAD
jgi:uncharacterized membrane protein